MNNVSKSKTQISTAGDLRKFLCNMMLGIKNGEIEINKATQITKMAEQVTNSLYSEMKMKQLQIAAGAKHYEIGSLPLHTSDDAEIIEQ